MKKIYLFLAAFFILNSAHSQCMLYPVSLQSRVNNSSIIIQGKVISSKSFWNTAHNNIFTSNLVSVTQVLKGVLTSSLIEVMTRGGIVDLDKQTVEPSLELRSGQEGIFMVNVFDQPSQYGFDVFQTHTDQQGFIKFNLSEDKAYEPFKTYSSINGELRSLLAAELNANIPAFNISIGTSKFGGAVIMVAPTISSFNPASITAGTASQLTITGTNFGAPQGSGVVRFQDADNGGGSFWITPDPSQYVSWNNTTIVVQVPTKTSGGGTAGTGQIQVVTAGGTVTSASTLTVPHGEINYLFTNTVTPQQVFNTRHHGQNGAGGMTWNMNTAFTGSPQAVTDFQAAFGMWRCATFINWQIGPTVGTATVAQDAINVIGFDNVVLPALPGGVLGVCSTWFGGCINGTNTAFYVKELDIVFDDASPWHYGGVTPFVGQYDFKSVVLHELGHGHQLSHVIDVTGVMHWSIASNQTKFTLNPNDLAGGNAVMARSLSGPVCSQTIMTALNGTNCALAAPVASFNIANTACVGQVIPLTDLSANNPNIWAWTMTGGAPASATTQNTSTSYGTTGVKTISLQTTNGTGSSAVYTKTVNIIASPTLAVTSNTMCPGNSVILTVSGTNSYTWNPGALTGSVQTLSPGATQIYTVTGSNGTCTNTAVGTVSVLNAAGVFLGASSITVCPGQSATITAGGSTNYTTMPGAMSGSFIPVTPSVSTTYTVTGDVGNSCTATNTITISVVVCVGIGENGESKISTLYPNPTSGWVTLNFNTMFTGKVNVYNTLGQLVLTRSVVSTETMPIDLTEFTKGVYTIRLSDGKKNGNVIKVMKE